MPSEPKPPDDRKTCLDSVINEIRQEPPCRTPAERDLRCLAARAELATLRKDARRWNVFNGSVLGELERDRADAQRWCRLRKRFFDKFGAPEAERECMPIDDSVLHRFLFDAWEDAKKWREYVKELEQKDTDHDPN